MATTTVKGADAFLAKVEARKQRVASAAAASLYRFMAKVMASSDSIIPVDTGRARSSHFIEPAVVSGDKVIVSGGYGGLPYIIPLHENLGARHPHGQAKFLELAMQEHASGARDWLAEDIARGIKDLRYGARAGTYPSSPSGGG